jgi:hypothetical protein
MIFDKSCHVVMIVAAAIRGGSGSLYPCLCTGTRDVVGDRASRAGAAHRHEAGPVRTDGDVLAIAHSDPCPFDTIHDAPATGSRCHADTGPAYRCDTDRGDRTDRSARRTERGRTADQYASTGERPAANGPTGPGNVSARLAGFSGGQPALQRTATGKKRRGRGRRMTPAGGLPRGS